MAKKRRTFQDKLRTQKHDTFVGRQAQLDAFEHNSKKDPEEDDRFLNIFNVHGQGGVGKTTLLNKFIAIAKRAEYCTVRIDAEDQRLLEVLNVMHRIAEELDKQGCSFKSFQKRYKTYLQEKGKLEADPQRPKGNLGKFVNFGVKAGTALGTELVPGAGLVKELLPTNLLADSLEQWTNFALQKIGNKDEVELVLHPIRVLTPLWIDDLYHSTAKKKVALFIDTFEAANPALESWLLDLLSSNGFPSILLTIGGRNPLHAERWAAYSAYRSTIALAPFTEAEAKEYLERKGIQNPEAVASILALSGRLPVFLDLLAQAGANDPQTHYDPNEKVVERFLRHINDPIQRELALHAALPSRLNQDATECLLPNAEKKQAKKHFEWLKTRSFVEYRGGHWAYHPLVRTIMQRHLKDRSEKEWDELHTELVAWYQQSAQKLETEGDKDDWIQDENWRSLLVEQHLHRLCINYKQYLPDVIRDWFAILFRVNQADAIPLAIALNQVEELYRMDDPWGSSLLKGIDYILNEEKEEREDALRLFKRISDTGWIKNNDDKASLYFSQGVLEVDEHKAIEYYVSALATKPDNYEALNNMGVAYASQGAYEKAIECYASTSEIKPDNHEAFYNMGNAYASQGAYEQAIESYASALAIKPDDHEAFYNMGNAYLFQGAYEQAIESYASALAIKPDYHEAFYNMGNAYASQGAYEQAIESYASALAIKPDYHKAMNNMGNAYYSQGAYEQAIACYTSALEIKPDDHEVLNCMGDVYYSEGTYEQAIACYTSALKIKPDDHEALNNMGIAYASQEDYVKAIESYESALAIKPDFYVALNNMGVSYASQKDYKQAIACYTSALKIKPDDHTAFYNMGNAYASQGAYEQAIESYVSALAIKPDEINVLHSIGWTYLLQGDLQNAQTYFLRAWKQSQQTHNTAAMNIGHLHLFQQDPNKALTWYQKSIPLWEDVEVFWGGMETDYTDLRMQERGITQEAYQQLLQTLQEDHT